MQVIRAFVIFFGLAIVAVGLYLFVLGVGAPIEIKSIELGWVKASATGTFVGLIVAGVGLAVSVSAMRYMKRHEHIHTEQEFKQPDEPGQGQQPTKVVTDTYVTMAPPEL